jgi:dihydroflavonol-4-reductase
VVQFILRVKKFSVGTGFIAGHLILQLLMRGYRVRATVRDLAKPESFAYLSRLQNAAENLELVEANLLLSRPFGLL